MKRILPLLLLFAMCATVVNAQREGGRGQNLETMKQVYKDSLQLTDVQLDSVTVITKEFLPKQREIMMNQDMSREDKFAAMKVVNEERNKRLKAVLSDDQFKKLQEMEQRRRQQRFQGGGRRGND